MHAKNLTRVSLLVIASIGCVPVLIFQPIPRAEMKAIGQRPAVGGLLQRNEVDMGSPVRLRIPGIKVDAAIEPVGVTSKGAMDTPKNPDNVGWYNLGPRPGEKGTAVFDGHLDWYHGKTAVFQHLNKLRKGDVLSVETDKGRFLSFVVREIRRYDPNEYAPDVFQNNDGSHLNLVTCGGVWDTVRKIYRERLVVFTDAVVIKP